MNIEGGVEAKIQLLSEYGHVSYQIKGNDAFSNMVARRHILALGVWSKGQNNFFSESSNVAYQIKGNGAKMAMQAYVLSLPTPSTPPTFLGFPKVVMLHIKLKGMEHHT